MEKDYIGVATKSALSVAHCASKKNVCCFLFFIFTFSYIS